MTVPSIKPSGGSAAPLYRRLAAIAALFVLLAGCSGSRAAAAPEGAAAPVGTTASPPAVVDLGYNVADIVFLQQMIAHHQVAAQLAGAASSRATSKEVQQLAATVLDESTSEVRQMSASLTSLGIDPGEAQFGGHTHGGGPTEADIAALYASSGVAFDRSFTDLMTSHSLGATQLAQAEIQEGTNTAAKNLAAGIVRRESDRTLALARSR